MPEVSPRAPDPHHTQPISRRTRQQTPSESRSPAGKEALDRSERARAGSAAAASAGMSAADLTLMHARLDAMATPRDTDNEQMAALRAILRDEALMAHVTANVEQWPPLSDEQRETLAALLNRSRRTE